MSWAAAITGLATTAYSLAQADAAKKDQEKAQKQARIALADQPDYLPTQSSRNLLANAAASKNAINPATLLAYRQAQQAAANQTANAQRNATSGSEALSVGAAAQNALQSLVPQLAADQTRFNMANKQDYERALANMSDEERRAFEAKRAKTNDVMNYNIGLAQGYNANKNAALGSAFSSLANLGSKVGAGFAGNPSVQNTQVATNANQASPYMTNQQIQNQINSVQSPAMWGWTNPNLTNADYYARIMSGRY